ncbi:MAG: LPS export ABC transporter periplasmic protein LptC [Elusimicrobiota bacterium]|jgi:LPS-assembly protein|nr:LPS export ABC transporter periplasmic protein LptC [Elusimicrobiota bacterium]
MKNKLFLITIFLLLCAEVWAQGMALPSPTKDEFIYFTADEVIYDQQNSVAQLKGNAEVFLEDGASKKVIRSDDIQIYTSEQILISPGPTTIEDEDGVFTAQDMHFDLATRRLIMRQTSADYSPIRVLSNESVEFNPPAYILRKATLTCCGKEKPHYALYAGKANIKPGERIYAFNTVLKIGKVPVLWLPFVYRSLRSDRLFTTYLDFDQSGKTGFGFLTSTVYSKNNFRAAANIDYYTKAGLGYGADVAYDDPRKFRGTLQAYAIHDNNKDEQRWGVNGGYWWQVHDSSDSLNKSGGAIYFSQLEMRNVSDPDFNDDFFRSNPYVVSPDQITRASVVRQSGVSTLRLAYNERLKLNRRNKTYSNAEEDLPKVDWLFNPFAVSALGGIVNTVSFSVNNAKISDYDFVQYMQGKWEVSRDLKPHRNFTLTPSAWYEQQAILKDPTNNDEDKFVARYGGQLNWRSALVTGLLDIGYRYENRTTSGSLTTDADAFDGGEESNLIYVQNYYNPVQNFYFKTAGGYDLRDSVKSRNITQGLMPVFNEAGYYSRASVQSWDITQRLTPVVAEAGYYNKKSGTNFFLQNIYDAHAGNQAFVLNTTFKGFGRGYANFGAANYSTDRDTFLFTTKFLVAPKNWTWRAAMGLDFSLSDGVWHAYSKQINITKNFHDFSIMAGVRDRNENLSFALRINIICGRARRPSAASQRIDDYWYPWRADGLVRDNF